MHRLLSPFDSVSSLYSTTTPAVLALREIFLYCCLRFVVELFLCERSKVPCGPSYVRIGCVVSSSPLGRKSKGAAAFLFLLEVEAGGNWAWRCCCGLSLAHFLLCAILCSTSKTRAAAVPCTRYLYVRVLKSISCEMYWYLYSRYCCTWYHGVYDIMIVSCATLSGNVKMALSIHVVPKRYLPCRTRDAMIIHQASHLASMFFFFEKVFSKKMIPVNKEFCGFGSSLISYTI